MAKFKIGDRVELIGTALDDWGLRKGRRGIVQAVERGDIGVEFPDFEGHSLGGVLTHARGWWIPVDYLKTVSVKKPVVKKALRPRGVSDVQARRPKPRLQG